MKDFSAQLGLEPKHVAFIGDNVNDVLFATSLRRKLYDKNWLGLKY